MMPRGVPLVSMLGLMAITRLPKPLALSTSLLLLIPQTNLHLFDPFRERGLQNLQI